MESTLEFSIPYSSSSSASRLCRLHQSSKGGALPPGAHAKGKRKISPSVDSPASLGIQLSPRFDMRPAARPRYLLPRLFISAFQLFSISAFQLLPQACP